MAIYIQTPWTGKG